MNANERRGRLGRVRKATSDEARDPSALFRPNAVLATIEPVPADLSPNEQRVAALVDGFRPLARVRSKSRMEPGEFRTALRSLADRGALTVVALIEEASLELSGLADESVEGGEPADGNTMPHAAGEAIPPHVMAEIEAMVDEEVRLANADNAFEDTTDVITRPKLD